MNFASFGLVTGYKNHEYFYKKLYFYFILIHFLNNDIRNCSSVDQLGRKKKKGKRDRNLKQNNVREEFSNKKISKYQKEKPIEGDKEKKKMWQECEYNQNKRIS